MLEERVRFQVAISADAATLARLRKQVREETYRGIYTDEVLDNYDFQKNAEDFKTQICAGDQRLFLVFKGDAIVGYFGVGRPLYWFPEKAERDQLFLNSLYICQRFWRKGIGKSAMHFMMQLAKEQGAKKLYNNCNMHNLNAIAFYRACGGIEIHSDGGHENRAEDQMTFEYSIN